MKYEVPHDESEILPNKLGLKNLEEIAVSEFEGFLQAEIIFNRKSPQKDQF